MSKHTPTYFHTELAKILRSLVYQRSGSLTAVCQSPISRIVKEAARSHHKINFLIAGKDYPATDEVNSYSDPILYIILPSLYFNGTSSLFILIKLNYYYTSDKVITVFV